MKTEAKHSEKPISGFAVRVSVLVLVLITNIVFLALLGSESRQTVLLEQERAQLASDAKTAESAGDFLTQYTNDIEVFETAFPTDETVPLFVQDLQNTVSNWVDEYTFRFNSQAPIPEQDKLFLHYTLTVKTDIQRFLNLLSAIEQMPYLSHITSITAKTPDGVGGSGEFVIVMKTYVQNPFQAK